MSDFTPGEVTKDYTLEMLESFEGMDLRNYYEVDEEVSSIFNNGEEAANFIKSNKPIKFFVEKDNMLYYSIGDNSDLVIFDIDVSRSFASSDKWISERMIPIASIFPAIVRSEISNEMTNTYISLSIASAFGGEFEEEFKEVALEYDFKKWESKGEDGKTFSELASEWIQLGLKCIKMVASAAKYALVREKIKKRIPSRLPLPEAVDLKFLKLRRDVAEVRFHYDNFELSESNRAMMTKLQIRIKVAERDSKIQHLIEEDSQLHQVWKLMNLPSTIIPPNTLLGFNRKAKLVALEIFRGKNSPERVPCSRDERIEVKKEEDRLKKVLRRAFLNKVFAEECEKFNANPEGYCAPAFL